jgi:hypothetical protein
MRRIEPHLLWVGNVGDVWDLRRVHEEGIAALVDLAINERPAVLPRELVYCRFPLLDGEGNAPWLIRSAVEVTGSLIARRVRTLVYCGAGLSRSRVIAAAALAAAEGGALDEWLKVVAEGGADVSPALWQDVKAEFQQGRG